MTPGNIQSGCTLFVYPLRQALAGCPAVCSGKSLQTNMRLSVYCFYTDRSKQDDHRPVLLLHIGGQQAVGHDSVLGECVGFAFVSCYGAVV